MRFDVLRRSWQEFLGQNDVRRQRRSTPRSRGRFEALEDRLLLTAAPTRVDYQISTDDQSQTAPAVDVAQNGDFVAAWTATVTDYFESIPTTHTVPVYRRYSANGLAKDADQVQAYNDYTLNQYDVDVAVSSTGNFVLVWTDEDSAGDTDIYFQRYSADGTAQGSATRANTTAIDTTNQVDPAVGIADNGDFTITWTHIASGGASNIYYRRYNANGTPKTNGSDGNATSDVAIANSTGYSQTQSDVVVGTTGNTIIVWTQQGLGYSNICFEALRGTNGTAYIPVTQANTTMSGNQASPSVDMDLRGYFDIAWTDALPSGSHDIRIRRFNASGAVRSPVDTTVASTSYDEIKPRIAVATGQYVVTWQVSDAALQQTCYQLFGDDALARQGVATLDVAFATVSADVAMDSGGEYALVAEHSGNAQQTIQGINYRNTDATVGLYNAGSAMYLLRNSNTSGDADSAFNFTTENPNDTFVAISGDWDGDGVATVGLYDQTTSIFYLTNSPTSAVSSLTFGFGSPNSAFLPVSGDWNNDGTDTIGVYDPSASVFYLRNTNDMGYADITVAYGPAGAGWTPVTGDWDGEGGDTIGLYQAPASTFYLRNSNTSGAADLTVAFGPADGLQLAVTGDWDNNGADTIGVYDPASSTFSLRNSNTSGYADISVAFGPVFGGWTPLANHWQAGSVDSIALFDASASTFYKRFSNTGGFADITEAFSPASTAWQPIVGDWDYDGVTTIGLYDASEAKFYLRNTNSNSDSASTINLTFTTDASRNAKPLAGDWNGDGVVTIGLFDPDSWTFYLKNSNTSGTPDITFALGDPTKSYLAVAGDWDGDGVTTIGLYDVDASVFYLRNSNSSGFADATIAFGTPGFLPIAGDWTRGGSDTIGVYDPSGSVFYLRNTNTSGTADVTVPYGVPGAGWLPVVGDWAGIGAASLTTTTAASGLAVTAALTDDQLAAVAHEAIDQWAQAGLSSAQVDALQQVTFRVADLPATQLGLATSDVIYIDADAAGWGWNVDLDLTPRATLDPDAVDQIDLATVVLHELGHSLGLGDLDASAASLMSSELPTGVQRLAGAAEVDAVLAAGL
jgi:hypothetical protein